MRDVDRDVVRARHPPNAPAVHDHPVHGPSVFINALRWPDAMPPGEGAIHFRPPDDASARRLAAMAGRRVTLYAFLGHGKYRVGTAVVRGHNRLELTTEPKTQAVPRYRPPVPRSRPEPQRQPQVELAKAAEAKAAEAKVSWADMDSD